MSNKGLGKRLREFRLARLATQKQMAFSIGIGLATLNRLENGGEVTDLTRAKVEKFLKSQLVSTAA